MNEKRRVCVVAPELPGPFSWSDIGAHCLGLAELWAAQGECDVTLLFSGAAGASETAYFRAEALRRGVQFSDLSGIPAPAHPRYSGAEHTAVSQRVFRFLREAGFDFVCFQDRMANGFIPIQAKRTGLALAETSLAVAVHSPSEWIREGMKRSSFDPYEEIALNFTERYCVEHADRVVSPSRHMLSWAQGKGWRMPADVRLIPCLVPDVDVLDKIPTSPGADFPHLAFFGPLETRRGLELFCQALGDAPGHGVRRVTFLGSEGFARQGPALDFIERACRPWARGGVSFEVKTDCGISEAVSFLRSSGALAVIPSLQENCPLSVLACLQNGVPFLASRAGGISELVSGRALFEPDARSLAEAIRLRSKLAHQAESLYSPEDARRGWLELAAEPSPGPRLGVRTRKQEPLVSVCVAHYNHGRYLPQLLESLARLEYPRFEVVAVDDGSTDPRSAESFARQEALYLYRGWRFLRKANEGIGATRNFAARQASGDYLIFMDADNVALPGMISAFVRGMEVSGADCLASHYHAFRGENVPVGEFVPEYSHVFMGPCLELGLLEDVFGDANFCIKKDAFWKFGGFGTERQTGWEDWEFLAGFTLAGYSQDVIPEVLYLYRYSEAGFSRATWAFENRKRVLGPYLRSRDFDWTRVCEGLLIPFYNRHKLASSGGPPPILHPDLRAVVEWVRWLDGRPWLNKPVTIPLKHARKLYRRARRVAAYISPTRLRLLSSKEKSGRS